MLSWLKTKYIEAKVPSWNPCCNWCNLNLVLISLLYLTFFICTMGFVMGPVSYDDVNADGLISYSL